MKTTLDGTQNCFSEIQLPNDDAKVGLKFKRKVLDVLQERDFLKRRRASARAPNLVQSRATTRARGSLLASNEPSGQVEILKREEVQEEARAALVCGAAEMNGQTRLSGEWSPASLARPADQQGRQSQRQNHQASARVEEANGAPRRPGGQFQAAANPQFCPYPNIVRQQQQHELPPKVLPNNTLVGDLCKCHQNLLPKVTRATAKTVELFRACAPSWLARRTTAPKKNQLGGHVNTNIILSASDDDEEDQKTQVTDCAKSVTRPAGTKRRVKFQVPEAILKLNTGLKPDDYNRALRILTNDVRFQLHLLLYRRLQTIWMLFSTILCILVPLLLLAAIEPLALAACCLGWLALQTLGALITRQFCSKLDQMLEKAVAQVNSYFMDHNLMLGVINVGGLFARARLVIPLLYFDTSQCREQIESILSVDLRKGDGVDGPGDKAAALEEGRKWGRPAAATKRERKFALNYSKIGLRKIGPPGQMSFAQSQLAKKIVLRYSQRWISFYDKQKLMFADDTVKPRHLSTGKCLCQFIEEHFKYADFSEPEEEAEVEEVGRAGGAPQTINVIDTSDKRGLEAEWRKCPPLRPVFYAGHLSPDLSLRQQLDLLVPTLSQLVGESEQPGEFSPFASNKTVAAQLQSERLESNSSPTTEHSSDFTEASDLTLVPSRNDELIKRLKLLLDSRKDEFARGLDGANQAGQAAARPPPAPGDRSFSQSGSTQTINLQEENGSHNNNSGSPISQLGRRFFSQADGIFFLGGKKSQQGVYGKQQQQKQILEIC